MKTFSHWRAVGRAMRWARRQEGVRCSAIVKQGRVEVTWLRGTSADRVTLGGAGTLAHSLVIDLADGRYLEAVRLPAADLLRVLAALELIPADIAYAAERPEAATDGSGVPGQKTRRAVVESNPEPVAVTPLAAILGKLRRAWVSA